MRMLKLLIRVSECLDRYEIVVVLELFKLRLILRSAMNCLYGNFTSNFSDIDPPTPQDYFS